MDDTVLADRVRSWEEGCRDGSSEACHSLAEYVQLVRRDVPAASELFRANCDATPGARFAPSCFALASIFASTAQNARALEYYDKSCAGGFSEGCYNLGVIYARGMLGVTPDRAQSERCFERACSTGVAGACFAIGANALREDPDKVRALHYFEKACILGDLHGCVNATVMLTQGAAGVPRDAERAAAMRQLGESVAKQMGVRVAQ